MSDKGKEYETGYKKAPKNHQFQVGQSGNPKGRKKTEPPTKRNFDTDFRNELDEIVTIKEGGKAKQLTKQQFLIKKLVAIALNGNPTAMKLVAEILVKMPIKDSDMLFAEAMKVAKAHLDRAKAENTLPAELEVVYNPADLLPIPMPKPRPWNGSLG